MTDDKTLVLATLDPAPFESAFGHALGLSYFVVKTAEEAFQLCEDLNPDYCVVDFKLNGTWNGYRAAKHIASKRGTEQSPKIYVMLKDYKTDGSADATWASHLQWSKNSGAAGLLPRDPNAVKQLMFGAQKFDRTSSADSVLDRKSPSSRLSKLSDFGPSAIEQRSMDKVDAVVRQLLVGPVSKKLIDGARDQVSKNLLAPDDYATYMAQKLANDEARRKFFAALDSEIKSQFMQTIGGSSFALEEINKRFSEMMGPVGPRFARATMEKLVVQKGSDFRLTCYVKALSQQIVDEKRRQKFLDSIQGNI